MKQKEQEIKIEQAKSYFGKKVILTYTHGQKITKEYTLINYYEQLYGDIKNPCGPDKDISEYSSSLFGILASNGDIIKTISMEQIIKAIDKNEAIKHQF